MKTRRQRKGGTRRVGGIFNAARAAIGNLKNGGGRVLQWNQIINGMDDQAFRMFKGMTIMMGGEDPTDPKYKNLNPLPTADYMKKVASNKGSATAQITAAAPGTQPGEEPAGTQNDGAEPEPGAQNDGAEPEPPDEPDAEPADPPAGQDDAPGGQKGGTRKNKRNRI